MNLFLLIPLLFYTNSTKMIIINNLIQGINERNFDVLQIGDNNNYIYLHKNPIIFFSIYHQNLNLSGDIIIITGSWRMIMNFLQNNHGSRFGRKIIIMLINTKYIHLITCFNTLWNVFRLRYILIFYENHIYSWNIFSEKISSWIFWEFKNALDHIEKVINNNKINFHGASLRVSLFDPSYRKLPFPISKKALFEVGIDGRVLITTSLFYNASILITTSSEETQYGGITKDGVLVGALGDIVSLKADFAANARFIKMYESSRIEFTIPLGIDMLCVMVPKADRIPDWEAILLSIPISRWTAIGCLYLLISGFLILISTYRRRQFNSSNIFNILFNTARPFLDTSFPFLSNNSAERILIISLYTSYGLFLSEFRSQLFGQLQRRPTYPQINSLKEFLSSKLQIQVSYSNLADTFRSENNDSLMDNLLKRVIINREPIYGKIAQLKRRSEFDRSNINKFHLISECPRTYFLAYALPQGSFLQPSLNILLFRLLSYGIIKHWYEDEEFIKRNISNLIKAHQNVHGFSIDDLAIAFWVYSLGMIISLLVFLIEHLWKCLYFHLIFPQV